MVTDALQRTPDPSRRIDNPSGAESGIVIAAPGAPALKGKSMIVHSINIGGHGADHFNLLIPGGGSGANSGCRGNNGMWNSGATTGLPTAGSLRLAAPTSVALRACVRIPSLAILRSWRAATSLAVGSSLPTTLALRMPRFLVPQSASTNRDSSGPSVAFGERRSRAPSGSLWP